MCVCVLHAMGGVSASVQDNLKGNTIKVGEGIEDDEYIIVRIDKFRFPINIITYYGEQESRTQNNIILEKWEILLMILIE